MSKTKFKRVIIKGISTVVPKKEINIYDEAEYYDNSIKKIDRMRKMVGFYKRRVLDDNITTASDLGIAAAEKLIEDMKIDKSTIDALVFVVQKPDYQAPATAYYIHNKLGLSSECNAFDINQGCAGFVYGLWVTSQMIESKTCKKVLLVCADTPSVGINPKDRNLAPIFGDGGTAVLLEYSENEIDSFYNIETRSNDFEAIIAPASGCRFNLNVNEQEDVDLLLKLKDIRITTSTGNETSFFSDYLDGLAVFNFTMSVVPENIKELMKYANINEKDVNTLCLHQANKQIVQNIADSAGFPMEKAPYHAFEHYGNNTMCSIPTTINSSLKEEFENNNKTVLCSGFGNGLVCASCIISLDNIYLSGIIDYETPKDAMTREEYIEYWINKMKG